MLILRLAIVAAAIVFYGAASTSVSAYETKLEGFQGTTWGMSEQEVQSVFKGQLSHWSGHLYGGNQLYNLFGIRKYHVDGCDFHALFTFTDNVLSKVSLAIDGKTLSFCPSRMTDILISKYGKPTTDEPGNSLYGESRKRKWFLGNTNISLNFTIFHEQNTTILSIDYVPSKTAGAERL